MSESGDTGVARQIEFRPGYRVHEWDEESSWFDSRAHWTGSYYAHTCRMWIPDLLTDDEDIEHYIEVHSDDPEAWAD